MAEGYLFALMPRIPATLLSLAIASSSAFVGPEAFAQGVPGLGGAQRAREPKTGDELVRARAFVVGEAKPGATVRVAVEFEIEKDWHIYWENSGESGSPTTIALDLPEGCTAPKGARDGLAIDFPVPQVFAKGETTFGYEGSVVLSVPVVLPAEIPASGLPVQVRSNWLVCKEQCLFGRNESTVDLARPVAVDSREAKALAEWLARRPVALAGATDAPTVALEGVSDDAAELVISWKAGGPVRFIPYDTPGALLESGYMAGSNEAPLRVALAVSRENTLGGPLEVGGLILVGAPAGKKQAAYSFRLPIPSAPPASGER